jgi:hypothetical protein
MSIAHARSGLVEYSLLRVLEPRTACANPDTLRLAKAKVGMPTIGQPWLRREYSTQPLGPAFFHRKRGSSHSKLYKTV